MCPLPEGTTAGPAAQGRRLRGAARPGSPGITPAICGTRVDCARELRAIAARLGRLQELCREVVRERGMRGGRGEGFQPTGVVHQTLGHLGLALDRHRLVGEDLTVHRGEGVTSGDDLRRALLRSPAETRSDHVGKLFYHRPGNGAEERQVGATK